MLRRAAAALCERLGGANPHAGSGTRTHSLYFLKFSVVGFTRESHPMFAAGTSGGWPSTAASGNLQWAASEERPLTVRDGAAPSLVEDM